MVCSVGAYGNCSSSIFLGSLGAHQSWTVCPLLLGQYCRWEISHACISVSIGVYMCVLVGVHSLPFVIYSMLHKNFMNCTWIARQCSWTVLVLKHVCMNVALEPVLAILTNHAYKQPGWTHSEGGHSVNVVEYVNAVFVCELLMKIHEFFTVFMQHTLFLLLLLLYYYFNRQLKPKMWVVSTRQ